MNLVAGIDCGLFVGVRLLDEALSTFPPYGPDGVATFALDLEAGFKLTLVWKTDIIPRADGTEQRIALWDRPKQRYSGAAKLTGSGPRLTRARMARFAAAGSTFLLGLAHESSPLVADHTGTSLVVPGACLDRCDWKEPGQRVIVRGRDGSSFVGAVLQDASGTSIALDDDPGDAGLNGGWVMPAMPILLEPQQNFDRYQTAVEVWQLDARAAIVDFAPAHAEIDLGALNAAWAGARIIARPSGLLGNVIDFELQADIGEPIGGELDEVVSSETIAKMKDGTDTLGDLATLLNTQSSNFVLVGTYNAAAPITSFDVFRTSPTGGADSGSMGAGAALTMYAGHPVWDREIANDETISDSVQALSTIIELGGLPIGFGRASYSQWGRAVVLETSDPGEWQWLKLFLATVRGRQRVFWLPSWRDDFTWVSSGVNAITVRSDDDSDIGAWYPRQRDRLMIEQVDGAITYVQISGLPVDNGDGTQTLTIDATLSAEDVSKVSWLEPCRFGGDTFEIEFQTVGGFTMETDAVAYAVSDPSLAEME